MQRWQLSKISGRIFPLLISGLAISLLPSCITSQPPKPFSSEALPTEAIAEISEIRSYPVRVKYLNSASARPATVGVPLKVNESVSTEESSNAQVTLRSGTIIRIGGKSNLTLKPKNQVEFISGNLVAWADRDRKAPAQVQTPFGEISSNNGTIYVEIPNKAAEDRRVIALDGTVTVLLKDSSQLVTLNKGEEISIKANGKASAPKRIDNEGVNKRIANNSLLFGFSTQLASLSQITSEFGVSASVKEASRIEFRRSDLPKPAENTNRNKVTYTSGSVNNDPPPPAAEPQPQAKPPSAAAPQNDPPPAPLPSEPAPLPSEPAPLPSEPAPSEPITNNPPPVATPIEPPAPQPAPLDPPPAPVQP
ncbi:FecR domain-containing protein [Pseudanabaena mucicola]|uniref:FecR domain-containing protein n=1 Tax=Pseudanabaena mucicola FACHB-723 TaxID=2692860 RepID=A0ABR7ZW27_9CYAN|nr:FecR domain-containing protein [Pseudanabaena mucicola]MBD2187752.1 FecR domain-containing protein [Pseudanabaena mucicola FACHB-723]